jgi:hypothetical protein
MAAAPNAADQYAAMVARVAELEAANVNLNQQGLLIQGQLAATQENLAAARARNVAKPKIPLPSTFSGRTGAAVDEWLEEMEKQFSFYPDYFATDAARIAHAIMYFAPMVTAWYRTASEEQRLAGTPIATWAAFVAILVERYQPVSASMTARANLDKITQTGGVAGYSQVFYNNMVYIKDMSAADQVHQYTRGLKQAIKFEVVKQRAANLTDAVNIAITAEALMRTSSSSSSSSEFTYRPSRTGHSGAGANAPMDVNRVGTDEVEQPRHEPAPSQHEWVMQQVRDLQAQVHSQQSLNAMFGGQDRRAHGGSSGGSGTKVPNISKEDYERCRREGVCIKCKEPGHIASKCSKPVRLNW